MLRCELALWEPFALRHVSRASSLIFLGDVPQLVISLSALVLYCCAVFIKFSPCIFTAVFGGQHVLIDSPGMLSYVIQYVYLVHPSLPNNPSVCRLLGWGFGRAGWSGMVGRALLNALRA